MIDGYRLGFPDWKFQKKNEKSTTVKSKTQSKGTFGDAIKKGEALKKDGGTSTPKYKKVTQAELDAKIAEKKKDKPADKLKVNYRRTKGEGIEGKSKGYRGDTRITRGLKKSGFTETRLAKLRKQHAEWKKRKKKKNK